MIKYGNSSLTCLTQRIRRKIVYRLTHSEECNISSCIFALIITQLQSSGHLFNDVLKKRICREYGIILHVNGSNTKRTADYQKKKKRKSFKSFLLGLTTGKLKKKRVFPAYPYNKIYRTEAVSLTISIILGKLQFFYICSIWRQFLEKSIFCQ